jgi:hypothetical protein
MSIRSVSTSTSIDEDAITFPGSSSPPHPSKKPWTLWYHHWQIPNPNPHLNPSRTSQVNTPQIPLHLFHGELVDSLESVQRWKAVLQEQKRSEQSININ